MRPPGWVGRDALLAAGPATDADVERWFAAFERMDRSEARPTMFMPQFFAYGRRPT